MSEDPCIWDRLPGLDPEMSLADRRAARIEPYESLASHTGPQNVADPEFYARDLQTRHDQWTQLLEPHIELLFPGEPKTQSSLLTTGLILFALVICTLLCFALLLPLGILFALALPAYAIFSWKRSYKARLSRALKHRSCPNCRYDLRSVPSGIDPGLLGGDPGPRRCPECGSCWPFLPPSPSPRVWTPTGAGIQAKS